MRFLVDENLPFSLTQLLREFNHDVFDVADSSLRGSPDERLWKLSARESRVIITKDLDFPFPHISPYPPGLILIRVPDFFTGEQITRLFSKALKTMNLEDLKGQIIVVSPGQIRFRPLQSK
ncbi:MAG: DUF5615 family PIN-like protein [Nitrospirae bacterium]|nr:DUF5615 family PIN-like protein [Nitrospirota bacterium]MBI3351400.1 DUF5615 family PIN-like protein [Nitrospirota bacterium]